MIPQSKWPARLDFGHAPETIGFWKRLVSEALLLSGSTPLYLFSALPIADCLAGLDSALVAAGFSPETANSPLKISFHHWLSFKTQPVAPLLRWWRGLNRPVEVVSEFELRAALAAGFPPAMILVNGPAKHRWLAQFQLPELSVNFDSLAELDDLLPCAQRLNWRMGLRILTGEEFDPENPQFPTQFGLAPEAAMVGLKKLLGARARIEMVSFHLRTNIAAASVFERAITEVAEICRAAGFCPQVLDIGGGLPVRSVRSRGGKVYDGEFGLRSFAQSLRQSVKLFPGLRELWLENGRFLSSASGVLVVKILDVKERRGLRQLICDGGRTLNALMSVWEQHALLPLPERSGEEALTVVHGPTCMAFDQLARLPLPRSLCAGDHLIWLDAGAYHLPWETRFSHGHAAVCWHDERGLMLARAQQSFEDFWGGWKY